MWCKWSNFSTFGKNIYKSHSYVNTIPECDTTSPPFDEEHVNALNIFKTPNDLHVSAEVVQEEYYSSTVVIVVFSIPLLETNYKPIFFVSFAESFQL